MKVGDPCESLYGWPILAIREPCPEHGCDRYDVKGPTNNHLNVCPACWREKRQKASSEKYYALKAKYPKSGYVADEDTAGSSEFVDMFRWSVEYDKNIERFWAARGMTEEDAIFKFGTCAQANRIVKARRERAAEQIA